MKTEFCRSKDGKKKSINQKINKIKEEKKNRKISRSVGIREEERRKKREENKRGELAFV